MSLKSIVRRDQFLLKLLLVTCAAVFGVQTPRAATPVTVTLSPTLSPSAGQPGVTLINVTGTNFPSGTIPPAQVTVTLTPATSGPAETTQVTAVTTIVGTTRRITFQITGPNVSIPTAYLVSVSGSTSTGVTFASGNTANLTVNPPANVSLTPNSAAPGQALAVTITGQYTNFVQGSTKANFGAGISVGGASAGSYGPVTVTSQTSATAQLTIDPAATPGPRTVTVATGVQQATLVNGFSVLGVPALVTVNPNTGQQGQQSLSINLTGQFTNWVQGTTTASFGPGITVVSVTVQSATTATVVVNIDPLAATGSRNVTLTTNTEVDTLTNGFTITAGTPILLSANPNSGHQGQQNLSVTIAGQFTHFLQGTSQMNFGAGITVVSVTVNSPVSAKAVLNIDPATPTGARTVTVTTGSEIATLSNGFTVTTGTPALVSANPNSGQQGQQNLPVVITGQFTHFQQGISQASFGGGITVVSLNVNSPASATAMLNIDPAAATGARAVTVTTGAEVATLSNGFTVTPSTPIGLSVSPSTGQQGQQNLSVTLTGQSSHFAQGASQASFGAGITVASLTVNSPTSAAAMLNIDPAAATGARTVTLATGGEVGTSNGFAVTPGAPILLSVNPSSGQQGQQNLPVIITGQFTHFAQGTSQATFGAGITVSSLTVNSPTSATAILNIDPAAATGARSVTLTTGTEAATLSNGFTVTASAPVLSVNPNTGQQGQQSLPVAITGQFTHFLQGTSQVSFGAGITVASLTVNSPTSAAAILNIDYSATPGARTVTLTTGTEVATLSNGFTVTAPTPILAAVNPNSGQQGQQNLPVTITGQFTHFVQGTSQTSFGSGITVVSLTVNSFTSATAVLNIDPAATPGVRTVTVTTGSEAETQTNAFTVTSQAIGITVTPTPVAFGGVPITTSSKKTITITSSGLNPLTVNSINIAGAFFTLGNLPSLPVVLAPTGTASFVVNYTPLGTISSNATVTVNSNAATSPTLVPVSGNGTPPPLPPAAAITVTTDQSVYHRAQPVQISGTLTAAGGAGIPNIPVTLQISMNGSIRALNPYTDAQGNYRATFQPAAGDGGTFSVTATATSGGTTQTASTTFRIFGLLISPAMLSQDLVMGNTVPVPLNLQNIGDAALNNVSYSANVSSTSALTASFPQSIATLAAGALVTVPVVLIAPSGNPPPTPVTVTVTITATDSTSGAADPEISTLTITLRPNVSTLALTPPSLSVGVNPGGSLTRRFVVQNNGYAPTNNSTVTLQDPVTFNWVSLGNANLGTLAAGASQEFQVLINPPATITLGNYTVLFNVSGGSNPLQGTLNISVTQSTLGAVAFTVSDDIGAKVGGATITLYSTKTNKVFQGVTGSNGQDTISGVDAGDYSYVVAAASHDPGTGTVTVTANATAQVNVLLSYDVVSLNFTVTPTSIVDQYTVTLNISYATNLPKPALQVVPPYFNFSFFPADVPNGRYPCSMGITNTHPTLEVRNVTADTSQLEVAQPSGQQIHVQFADGTTLYQAGTLAPQATVNVACYATVDGSNVPTHSAGNIVVQGNYDFSLDGNLVSGTTTTNVPVSYTQPKELSYQPIQFTYDLTDPTKPVLTYDGSFVYTVTSERNQLFNFLAPAGPLFGGHNLVAFTATQDATSALDLMNANQANVFWHTDFSSLKQSLLASGDTSTYDISTLDNGLTLQQALSAQIVANPIQALTMPAYLGFEGQWADRSAPNGYLVPIQILTVNPDHRVAIAQPGTSSLGDCLNPEDPGCLEPLPFEPPGIGDGVIQIQIAQKIRLERQAFNAMLGIGAQVPLNNTVASIQIRDANGNDASSNFFVLVTSDPLGATHGGTVAGQTSVSWQLIPNAGAGGTLPQGTQYQVQATLSYVVNGTAKNASTQTVTITVLPSPKLSVAYTAPFVVVDGKDAKIRVTIQNTGAGTAHDLSIQSAQPTILVAIPADPTLPKILVDFNITGSSNTADSSGFQPGNLTINFGDVAPGATVSGYWTLRVSRRGFFVGFSSTFTHQDYQGVALDPLVLPPTTTLVPAIGGTVTNDAGQVIPNLTVSLSQGTTTIGSDQTSVTGEYYIPDLAPGSYLEQVTDAFGKVWASQNITVVANQATNFIDIVIPNFISGKQGSVLLDPSSLVQVYDGTLKSVKASTSPPGLAVNFTYSGSAIAPVNAGTYSVVATINDPAYQGSANAPFTITKATPLINWPAPAAIVYGTPLSSTQLDASAIVGNSIVTSSNASTVLAPEGRALAVAMNKVPTTQHMSETSSVRALSANTSAAANTPAPGSEYIVTPVTSGPTNHEWPAINNNGDIVWSELVGGFGHTCQGADAVNCFWQVQIQRSGDASPFPLAGQQPGHNNKFPVIDDAGDVMYLKDGVGSGPGLSVVLNDHTSHTESTIEFSSGSPPGCTVGVLADGSFDATNTSCTAYRAAGRGFGISTDGTTISYHDFCTNGSCTRTFDLGGGSLPGSFNNDDYPDVNAIGSLVYAGVAQSSSGNIYLNSNLIPIVGNRPRINRWGDIAAVSFVPCGAGATGSGPFVCTWLSAGGSSDDYANFRLVSTGTWAGINDSEVVVFEATDSNGYEQVFRATFSPQAIDISPSANILLSGGVCDSTLPHASSPGVAISCSGFWDAVSNLGTQLAVVQAWGGSQVNTGAAAMLNAARTHSPPLQTAVYCYLNYADPGDQQVDICLNAAGTTETNYLKFVAIDVETKYVSQEKDVSKRVAIIGQALKRVTDTSVYTDVNGQPLVPIIYTAQTSGAWSQVTGDSTLFSNYPLWIARDDTLPGVASDFAPFDGWKAPAGKQYDLGNITSNGTFLFQVDVDLDTFAPSLFSSPGAPNTPSGANVIVQPLDAASGTAPVTIKFANIQTGGISTVVSSKTGPPPPSGFASGNPSTYYDVQTTAVFTGTVSVCINYSLSSYLNPIGLGLFHYVNNAWIDATVTLDLINQIVCGSAGSLSPFAVFERITPVPVPGPFVYAPPAGTLLGAGSQTLSVTFTPTDTMDYFPATATVTLQVNPAAATVTLNAASLTQIFDGTPKSVTVTTSPPNLSVSVSYTQNGTTVTAPTNAGTYNVTATITDPNYQGSATGTLTITGVGACVAPPAGLISWWSGNGDTSDSLGANNPSASNAVTFVAGEVGKGFTFGTGGYIDIPASPSLANQQFTWSAWARPDGPGPNNDALGSVIVGQDIDVTHASVQLLWRATDSHFLFVFGSNSSELIVSTDPFAPGQFYLVTGTYDGSTFKLFVNGSLEGQLALAKTIAYSSLTWTIGSTDSTLRTSFPRTWNGVVDEVQAFSRALSQSEIQAIFAAGGAGECRGQAAIGSVNPNVGSQGQQNLSVAITGQFTNWLQGTTTATFGAGISLVSLTVNSPTSATAVLNIDLAAASGARTVTLTTGSEIDTLSNGFTVNLPSDLTVSKTHSGSFKQGDIGDTYTITVTNSGTGPTVGMVTISDTLPTGLTATAITGTGWTCPNGTLTSLITCTRSDVLAAGASYPSITLTVNVAVNAAVSVTNTVTVSGGGEVNTANDTASDVTSVIQVASCLAAPSGLVSWWAGNGDTSDLLGANNPSASNAVTFVAGEVGKGFTFGTGGYIDIPASPSLANQQFTWSAWARPDGPGPNNDQWGNVIVSQFSDNVTGVALFWRATDSHFVFEFGNQNSETIVSQHAFPTGQFYLVTGTYDGSNFTLYVNGNLEAQQAEVKTISYSASNELTIGAASPNIRAQAFPRTWNGVIDEVQAFNRALSQSEIQAIFAAGGAGECRGQAAVGSVTPNAGSQGQQSLSIAIAGQFTNWAQGTTTASLGAGITVASLTINSPTSATAVVNIDPAAALGARTVTLTTGSEIDTLSNGFTVNLPSDLTVSKTHSGSFKQGDTGDTYTITVTNSGTGPTTGVVIITDTLPAGLTATAITGTGWACPTGTLTSPITCTRSDVLAVGASYPSITLTVNVAANAAASVTNTVTVSGGGEVNTANDTASDVTSVIQVATCVAAPSGLVSWWAGNGDTSDSLGANNPSASNAVTFVAGEVGKGFMFGTGGYIDIPASASLANQQFTWSAWARPDGPGPNNDSLGNSIVEQDIDDTHASVYFGWRATDNRFVFAPGDINSELIASQHTFSPGQFYLVTVTYDSSTFSLFVNGNLEGQLAEAKTIPYSSISWTIGAASPNIRSQNFPRTWNGVIDEVQAFNRALAQSEIQAIFAASGAGECRGQAAIGSVNPNAGSQGQQNLSVAISGQFTNWVQGTTTATFGVGITVVSLIVTAPTSATAVVNIDPAAASGARTVTLTTGTEIDTSNGFTVTSGTPVLTLVSPNVGLQGQQNESVTLTGQFTHWVQGTTSASFGAGITVATLTINSATSATAVLNIDPAAAAGARNATVTTNAEVVTLTNGFTVTPGTPLVIGVKPNTGQQGQANIPVTITANFTHFSSASVVTFSGAGVTASAPTAATATSLTVNVTIGNAALGARDITVTTGTEIVTLPGAFTVLAGTPVITNINPNTGQQGQNALPVTITGNFTHFSNASAVTFSGTGVTAGAATASTTNSLTVNVNIAGNAATGGRDVTVTTGSEIVTSPGGFTVQTASPPTITSLSLKSALAGTQRTLQVSGATLLGASFAFQPASSPPIVVQVNSIDPSGSSASMALNIPSAAIGTFALVATGPSGSSTSTIVPKVNRFTVVDPNSNADTDGDGFSDVIEATFGTDPLDPTSFPVIAAATETESVAFSVLNAPVTAAGITETESVAFSVLNASVTGAGIRETESVTFSVLNAPAGISGIRETESYFSVVNNAVGVTGQKPTPSSQTHPPTDGENAPERAQAQPIDPFLDSDGDGLPDWYEMLIGTDPYNPDTDGDGLTDFQEVFIYHTNPLNPDTDGDGFTDGVEILFGSDPLNPNSTPLSVIQRTAVVKSKPASRVIMAANDSTKNNSTVQGDMYANLRPKKKRGAFFSAGASSNLAHRGVVH